MYKHNIIASTVLGMGIFSQSGGAFAKVKVVATTSDLGAIAAEIVGDDGEVETLAAGSQDPHTLEAKPSYMVKVHGADLVVAVGLELEVGWLPNILHGARNPAVLPGRAGYLEVGPLLQPLEIPTGPVSRADGDVHAAGNPHVTLDPLRVAEAGELMAARLGELDRDHAPAFKQRSARLSARLAAKTKDWQARLVKAGVTKVITYHRTLSYFLDRFAIKGVATLEPIPGVPPTAKHVLGLKGLIKSERIPLILVENLYDPAVAERLAKEMPGLRVALVSVAVDRDLGVNSPDELFERLVRAIEGHAHG